MIGQIQATNQSKSGKTIGVQVNNQWYTSKNWELVENVGKTIIFEPSEQAFPDGSKCHWLNDYVFDDAQTTPAGRAMNQALLSQPVAGPALERVASTTIAPQVSKPDKDALIGALALTKAMSGPKDQVWDAFVYFYNKLLVWDHRTPF